MLSAGEYIPLRAYVCVSAAQHGVYTYSGLKRVTEDPPALCLNDLTHRFL